MPGGSPGSFVLGITHFEFNRAAPLHPNAHVHVDDGRFPLGRDGRATARARIVDDSAEYCRRAPILSEDRGSFIFHLEDAGMANTETANRPTRLG